MINVHICVGRPQKDERIERDLGGVTGNELTLEQRLFAFFNASFLQRDGLIDIKFIPIKQGREVMAVVIYDDDYQLSKDL